MLFQDSFHQVFTIQRIFVALVFLLLPPGASRADSWTAGPPMPTARSRLAVAQSVDGRIFAIGGAANGVASRTVEAYDASSGTWMALAPMPTARAELAAATASDGRIFALGGSPRPGPMLSTVEIYSPRDNTWTVGPNMTVARGGLCAAAGLDGKIYVFGGRSSQFTGVPLNSVEAYDPTTSTWTLLANMPTGRFNAAAALGPDGKIYVVGGSGFSLHSAAEVYDPATNTWNTLPPMPTAREALAAAVGADGRIYAIGGWNWVTLDTVESYDRSTGIWRTNASMPTVREGLGAAPGPGAKIFAVGGDTVPYDQGLPTMEVYDPLCPAPAPTCGQATCGTVSNGCGQSVNCGTCQPAQVCVGDGSTTASCCTPRTFCPRGACGVVEDGCGGEICCGLPSRCCF